jgi:hypothetical protein
MATHIAAGIAAQDGVAHEPSSIAEVHRPLVVVDPPMEGRDVANLQRAAAKRLEGRGLGEETSVPTHGKFTLATAFACIEAEYFLGLRPGTYLSRDMHGHRIVTEGAQRIIRNPETREPEQRERAMARKAMLEQDPQFFEKVKEMLGITGRGVEDALAYAAKHVGTKENPPGSNSGPLIDKWCTLAGFDDPVPWCGCFVNACLVAGGLPSGVGFIGSTTAILARAKKMIGGYSFHGPKMGMPGDLALYDDDMSMDPVVHVEIVRARMSDTMYSTYGGNTSSGDGSPSDGGMVARHDNRSTMGAFHIIGFARPPWDTV